MALWGQVTRLAELEAELCSALCLCTGSSSLCMCMAQTDPILSYSEVAWVFSF